MANRSYLYATNSINAPKEGYVAIGMSEYSYNVHPLYELLVSQDAQLANSQIWDQENLAIVGNLEQGKKLVLDFLRMLNDLDPDFQTDEFKQFIEDTIGFFEVRTEKYALLEGGEIYDMEDGELQEMAATYLDSAKEAGIEVRSLLAKHSKGELTLSALGESDFYDHFVEISTAFGDVEAEEIEWNDFWSTILYYSLGGEE